MVDEVREMPCSSCDEVTEHKKMNYKGKTAWKCQVCYSLHFGWFDLWYTVGIKRDGDCNGV